MKRLSVVVFLVFLTIAGFAWAKFSFMTAFNTRYGTAGTNLDDCNTCHIDGQAYSVRNPYGADVKIELDKSGNITTALQAVEDIDSDGDGDLNITEINAGTLPGDSRNSTPVEQSTWGGIKSLFN